MAMGDTKRGKEIALLSALECWTLGAANTPTGPVCFFSSGG
jgi:hypothetical protein